MTGPPTDHEGEGDDDGARDIADAIRAIQGEDDRPLTREEAKAIKKLRESLPKPPRQYLRDLGKRLARPEDE